MHLHVSLTGGIHGVGVCLGPVGFFVGVSFVGDWIAAGAKVWYEAGVFSLGGTLSKLRGDVFIYHRFPLLKEMEAQTGAIVIADHKILRQEGI